MQTIISPNSITLVIDGEPHIVSSSDKLFHTIKDAVQRKAPEEEIKNLLDPAQLIAKFSGGRVEISDGKVYLDDEEIHTFVSTRILEMLEEGFDPEPLTNFLVKVQQNPSYRTRRDLYQFLEYGGLALFSDGDFTAYKYVRDDYYDQYSGTKFHGVGATVEMDRRECDDDPTRTCSAGLHFCSYEYLPLGYAAGPRILQLKINPADVVAIPVDYNNTKGRACRYQVFKELERKEVETDSLRRAVADKEARRSYRVASLELDRFGGFVGNRVDVDTPDGETVLSISKNGIHLGSLFDADRYVATDEDGVLDVQDTHRPANPLFDWNEDKEFDADRVTLEVRNDGDVWLRYDDWVIGWFDPENGVFSLTSLIDPDSVPFPVDQNGIIKVTQW